MIISVQLCSPQGTQDRIWDINNNTWYTEIIDLVSFQDSIQFGVECIVIIISILLQDPFQVGITIYTIIIITMNTM